jgi:transcriptional regulator with XRE-family HTH domain
LTEDLDTLLDRIGRRIIRRRQELGLSQRQLAALLGIAPPNIGRIERGEQNVTLGTLCKIAKELGVTVEALIVAEPPGRSP